MLFLLAFILSYLSGWLVGWCKNIQKHYIPAAAANQAKHQHDNSVFEATVHRELLDLSVDTGGPLHWRIILQTGAVRGLSLSPWFREGQHEGKCTHLLVRVLPPQVNGLCCWALPRSAFWSFPFKSRFEDHDLILILFIFYFYLFF